LNQRGYLVVEFDQLQVQSKWIFVDSIKQANYSVDESRQHQLNLDVNLLPIQTAQQVA
jgi:alkaline phosphatase D